MGRSRLRPLGAAVLVAAVACGCGQSSLGPTPPPPGTGGGSDPTPLPRPRTEILVGAADIAQCDNDGGRPAEATAKLLDTIPGTIFTAGDNVYYTGSESDFANCYERTWGRHKRRTRPSPGNHEYETAGASAYYRYFGANAGPSGLGWYSYDLGRWHIISLNSVAPMSTGNAQYVWLQDDLSVYSPLSTTIPNCTLVYFHHPRFTSGPSGNMRAHLDLWRLMYTHGVDVVVNGHDHIYERFEPVTPDGVPNANGIRQFVVGTGGASLYAITPVRNSALQLRAYGVLKFTLRNIDYDWEFIQAGTETISDKGTALCH